MLKLLLLFALQTTALCLNCGKSGHSEEFFEQKAATMTEPIDEVLPWTVVIGRYLKSEPHCMGTLVVKDQFTGHANSTDLVVTSGRCVGYHRLYYVAPTIKEDGKVKMDKSRKSIKKVVKYSYKYGSKMMKRGVAVVTLKEPIKFTQEKSAVCIAKYDWKQPQSLPCFMTLFNTKTRVVETWPITAHQMKACTIKPKLLKSGGYCSNPLLIRDPVVLGAPLMCAVHGRMYQFGIYADSIGYSKVTPLPLFIDLTRYQSWICGHEVEDETGDLPPMVEEIIESEQSKEKEESSESESSPEIPDESLDISSEQMPSIEEEFVTTPIPDHECEHGCWFDPESEKESSETKPSPEVEEEIVITTPEPKPEVESEEISGGITDVYEPEEPTEVTTDHHHVEESQTMFTAKSVHVVQYKYGSIPEIVCTGSVIAAPGQEEAGYVLTAATCVWDKLPFKYGVYFGSEETLKHKSRMDIAKVDEIVTFPEYRHHHGLKAMGVGLMKLNKTVHVGEINGAVYLPDKLGVPLTQFKVCVISGVCKHGRSSFTEVIPMSDKHCKSRLRGDFYEGEYCAVVRKDSLKIPKGAALSCLGTEGWKEYGVYEFASQNANLKGLYDDAEDMVDEVEIAVFSKILRRPSITWSPRSH